MKSPKTYTLVLLALTTIGGAMLGWRQYQELVELRATAMNRNERADLQKRLWNLEKLNKDLQDQLAALRGSGPEGMLAGGDRPPRGMRGERGAPGGPGGIGGRGGPGPNNNPLQQIDALRQLMAKPEVQALLNVQQKAAIDARYASLFRNLNLSPEQRAKFEGVLSEYQATQMDVRVAAEEQGIRDPAGIRKLMGDAQNDFNNNLKAVLGDAGFAQFQSYEQTMPQRNVVNQLQQRLSYTDTPLSPAQADALVNILAANTPRRQADAAMPAQPKGPPGVGPGGPGVAFRGDGGAAAILGGLAAGDISGVLGAALVGGPGGGRGALATAPVTPAAVNQAQGILSQPQVAALQQIQQQQQTQQQLQQIVRDTMAGSQPPGGTPPPAGDGKRKRG